MGQCKVLAEIQGCDMAIPFSHHNCHGPQTGICCLSLSSSLLLLPSLLTANPMDSVVSVLHLYNYFLFLLIQLPLFFTRHTLVLLFYFFSLSCALWSLPPTKLILDFFLHISGPCFRSKKPSKFFLLGFSLNIR